MTQEATQPLNKRPSWQHIGLFLILMIAINLIYDASKKYISLQSTPVSAADAQAKMVGVWTYAEPLDFSNDPFPFEWIKWDIRADGTMTIWHTSPTSNDWGTGETIPYQIVSDKYASTGERWFGIEAPDGYTVGVYEGGHIVLHMRPAVNTKTGTMQRGDSSPF